MKAIAVYLFSAIEIVNLVSTLACAAPKTAEASTYVLDADKSTGSISFDALGKPSMLKIHGQGEAPKGQIQIKNDKASGSLTFQLDTLATGIALRDEHMKKRYLEVEKFPNAKLTLSDFAVPSSYASADFKAQDVPFKGTLSLHGVEKPIEGVVSLERKDANLILNAKFPVKTADFGIKTPSFAGVTMGEDVRVEAKVDAPFSAR